MTIMKRSAARFHWKTELPKHVIYMYRSQFDDEWKEYTYAERNAERKKQQEKNIDEKRSHMRRVPCYIHVFNINTNWLFGCFYIMILSKYGKWYLNWKVYDSHKKFLPMIKQHFNFGMFYFADDNAWCKEFCKAYPMKPKGIQNPRGKYLTHCIIDSNNNLIDIELGDAA